MFKQVVWVPSYRGNTAAHEDNYTKPLKILPYPQGSYSLSLIATIIEKIKRRKTCFTTKLKLILLCLPYVHFAASHAVHFFPQIEANELLIFPLFHETEWASLAILHGYSPFPCCLWQPWGVPWSQMGNLAALASGALRSTPRGTGGPVCPGDGHTEAVEALLWLCLSQTVWQRQRWDCTELFHTQGQPAGLAVLTHEQKNFCIQALIPLCFMP